jgi:hypothetical protein
MVLKSGDFTNRISQNSEASNAVAVSGSQASDLQVSEMIVIYPPSTPPSQSTSSQPAASLLSESSQSLGSSEYLGGIIGGVLAFIIIASGIFLGYRRLSRLRTSESKSLFNLYLAKGKGVQSPGQVEFNVENREVDFMDHGHGVEKMSYICERVPTLIDADEFMDSMTA